MCYPSHFRKVLPDNLDQSTNMMLKEEKWEMGSHWSKMHIELEHWDEF